MIKNYIFLGLFAMLGSHLIGQTFDTSRMDSLLQYFLDEGRASTSVAINIGGETVYNNSYGLKDISENNIVYADADSRFRIGSITKTFTATLILKAIEEGHIKLETSLSSYYPKIVNAEKISIEHLLRHRSGINNYTDNLEYRPLLSLLTDKNAVKEMMITLPSDFEPDAQFSYSNTGYMLLGYILEDIYKKEYRDLVKEYIIDPLGIQSYGYLSQVRQELNEVKSFINDGSSWMAIEDFTSPLIVDAAGAITMTAADLGVFWHALMNGSLVSKASLELMTTMKDNYGLGLFKIPYGVRMGISHNGGIDGFNSNASYWEEKDMSVIVFVNGLNMEYNNILIGVLSVAFGDPYTYPTWDFAEVDISILGSYQGTYENPTFPMDIKIFVEDGQLYGQATGQGAFPLNPESETKFTFSGAAIIVDFDKENGFHFNQNGYEVDFTKKD